MDFKSIDSLTDENLEDLYNDAVFGQEEVISVYTVTYFNVYCRTGTLKGMRDTGYGVTYGADVKCGDVQQSVRGFCGVKTPICGTGGWNHVYNIGIYNVCREAVTGYSCFIKCTYYPNGDGRAT